MRDEVSGNKLGDSWVQQKDIPAELSSSVSADNQNSSASSNSASQPVASQGATLVSNDQIGRRVSLLPLCLILYGQRYRLKE